MSAVHWITVSVVLAGVAVAGWIWWRRHTSKTPAERERERRLAVNARGRLGEALIVDDPSAQLPSPNTDLIFYRYRAGGMEYAAAQDISALRHLLDTESCRPGLAAAVKYDPQRPSNSILICEVWSGFHAASASKPQVPPAA